MTRRNHKTGCVSGVALITLSIISLLFFSGTTAFSADGGERDLSVFPCHSYSEDCGKLPPPPIEQVEWSGELGDVEDGREIAFSTPLGNCLACHKINGGDQGGTIGPSLVDYAKRDLPYEYTYQRIYDTRVYNPDAHMPPFGPNDILTDQQIRDVMAFLYSLD